MTDKRTGIEELVHSLVIAHRGAMQAFHGDTKEEEFVKRHAEMERAEQALLAHVAGLEKERRQAEAEAERMRGIVGMLLEGRCPSCGWLVFRDADRVWRCVGRGGMESAGACGYETTVEVLRSALAGEDGGRDV
jgi:hypothetical protein